MIWTHDVFWRVAQAVETARTGEGERVVSNFVGHTPEAYLPLAESRTSRWTSQPAFFNSLMTELRTFLADIPLPPGHNAYVRPQQDLAPRFLPPGFDPWQNQHLPAPAQQGYQGQQQLDASAAAFLPLGQPLGPAPRLAATKPALQSQTSLAPAQAAQANAPAAKPAKKKKTKAKRAAVDEPERPTAKRNSPGPAAPSAPTEADIQARVQKQAETLAKAWAWDDFKAKEAKAAAAAAKPASDPAKSEEQTVQTTAVASEEG